MKKVSIIIPVYNGEKTIQRCLKSLFEQTYKNMEILIINDGSKDGSDAILKSVKDERVTYIVKENSGAGDTRNYGLERATGDYIMFLDIDDYIEPHCVETLVNAMEKDECDVAVTNYYIESNRTIEFTLPFHEPTTIKETPEILTKVNLAPWNKIYRAYLFKEKGIRFPLGLKYEDAPVVISALVNAKKIGFVDDYLFHYTIEPTGETFTRNEKIFDIIEICKLIDEIVSPYDYIDKTDLIVKILTYYLKNSRFIKDVDLRERFVKALFQYLDGLDKNWRKSPYLKETNLLKRFVLTHRTLLKMLSKKKRDDKNLT